MTGQGLGLSYRQCNRAGGGFRSERCPFHFYIPGARNAPVIALQCVAWNESGSIPGLGSREKLQIRCRELIRVSAMSYTVYVLERIVFQLRFFSKPGKKRHDEFYSYWFIIAFITRLLTKSELKNNAL